jgi:hypothetical protein
MENGMTQGIDQNVLDLPDTCPDKSDLIWCTAIQSCFDFHSSSPDIKVLIRAVNTAVNVAVKKIKEAK